MVLLSLWLLWAGLFELNFVFNNETNTVAVFHKEIKSPTPAPSLRRISSGIRTAPNSLTSAVSVTEGWIIVN